MAQTTVKMRQIAGGLDGWIPAEQTWTYASASTITVPSGAASRYQKGDKIKITNNSATKYFYVVGVADTVLTVTGGSDYTVHDSAITNPYFSKIENPQGFPSQFAYTASYYGTGGSAGSYAESSYTQKKFYIKNARVYLDVYISIGNKGSWTGGVRVTLPVSPIADAKLHPLTGSVYNGVSPRGIPMVYGDSSWNFILFYTDLYDATGLDCSAVANTDSIAIGGSYPI